MQEPTKGLMSTASVSSPPSFPRRARPTPTSVKTLPAVRWRPTCGQTMNVETNTLLRAILGMTARQAIGVDDLLLAVAPKGSGEAQMEAYNLCDGNRTQGQIAKEVGLDSGNFSRTV